MALQMKSILGMGWTIQFLTGTFPPEEVLNDVKGLKMESQMDPMLNEMLQLSIPLLANAYAYFFHIYL